MSKKSEDATRRLGVTILSVMDVNNVVTCIKEYTTQRDHEAAGSLEWDLFRDVLRSIANGAAHPRALAAAALEATKIEYRRVTS